MSPWRSAAQASDELLREYREALRRTQAPPIGCFVTKSWMRMLEELVRKGQAAQALHMIAIQQSQPMRMPTLAEWPT